MKSKVSEKILHFCPRWQCWQRSSFSAQTGTQSGGLSQNRQPLAGGALARTDRRRLLAGRHRFAGQGHRIPAQGRAYDRIRPAVSGAYRFLLGLYRIRPKLRIPLTLLICAAVAAYDEFHQSLSPDAGHRCGMWASIPWAHCAHWVY